MNLNKTVIVKKHPFLPVWIPVLLTELIIFVMLASNLFGHHEVMQISPDTLLSSAGAYEEARGGYYIDQTSGYQGDFTISPKISLKKGVYRVVMEYVTDTDIQNLYEVTDTQESGALLSNQNNMYAGMTFSDNRFWLLKDSDTICVKTIFSGSGSLLIKDISIYETNDLDKIILFSTSILMLFLNWLILVFLKYQFVHKDKNRIITGMILAMSIVLTSVPLFTDYLWPGSDLTYHMQRIEGIATGLLAGEFPVRMYPQWLAGHGYADSIFYGNTLLYIPALLRLIGFPMQTAYKALVFFINAATVLVAYYSYKRIFQSRYLGLFGSILTSFSIYRVYKLYTLAGIGECLAMIFLPLVAYGFYRIFTQDTEDKNYHKNWIVPVVGFSGIIQSHILTCEILGLFIILLCLILWKKTFQKAVFLVLTKVVIFTVLINMWFILPFMDYTLSGDYKFMHAFGRHIQERGLYLAHLFFAFYREGSHLEFRHFGMNSSVANGLGYDLLLGIALFVFVLFMKIGKPKVRIYEKQGILLLLLGLLASFMCLNIFPWDAIWGLNSVTASLVSSLQFPARFLMIATGCLIIVTCIGVLCVRDSGYMREARAVTIFIAAVCVITTMFTVKEYLKDKEQVRIYDPMSIGTGYVSGGEYVPYDTNTEGLFYEDVKAGEGMTITSYEKENLTITIECSNDSDRYTYLELPLLCYKGYKLTGDVADIVMKPGNNHMIRLIIPAGYEGTIVTSFQGMWYWRLAELITLFSGIYMVFVWKSRKIMVQ